MSMVFGIVLVAVIAVIVVRHRSQASQDPPLLAGTRPAPTAGGAGDGA